MTVAQTIEELCELCDRQNQMIRRLAFALEQVDAAAQEEGSGNGN